MALFSFHLSLDMFWLCCSEWGNYSWTPFLDVVRLYQDYCHLPRFRYKPIILTSGFWPAMLRSWKSTYLFSQEKSWTNWKLNNSFQIHLIIEVTEQSTATNTGEREGDIDNHSCGNRSLKLKLETVPVGTP